MRLAKYRAYSLIDGTLIDNRFIDDIKIVDGSILMAIRLLNLHHNYCIRTATPYRVVGSMFFGGKKSCGILTLDDYCGWIHLKGEVRVIDKFVDLADPIAGSAAKLRQRIELWRNCFLWTNLNIGDLRYCSCGCLH
jgi:hypothetical protein